MLFLKSIVFLVVIVCPAIIDYRSRRWLLALGFAKIFRSINAVRVKLRALNGFDETTRLAASSTNAALMHCITQNTNVHHHGKRHSELANKCGVEKCDESALAVHVAALHVGVALPTAVVRVGSDVW